MKYSTIKEYARLNRLNPTVAEAVFWNYVKNRKFLGFRFNRQYVVKYKKLDKLDSYFIVDFICFQKNLAVEIDGQYHDNVKEYDQERNEILKTYGWNVIHFKNEDVLHNWLKVEEILTENLVSK